MDIFSTLTGWIVAALAALAALVGVFFKGKSKGKQVEKEKHEKEELQEQAEGATKYQEAVEDRQKIDEKVKSTDEEAIRDELTDWVDFEPADELRDKNKQA